MYFWISFLGFYGTWGRALMNGTLLHLFTALHAQETLPGTTFPFRTRLTGIYWPIDYLLDVLIGFFWQAVDGSHPTASLVGLYFAGQHASVVTTLLVDSYRATQRTLLSSAVFWLLAFQLTAIATSGPWLVALCLTNSSSVGAVFAPSRTGQTALADPNAVRLLPASIALGYVLPLVLMGIPSPSVVSNSFQQLAIAAWNLFPLLIAVAQSSFVTIASFRGSPRQPFSRSASLKAVRFTYGLTVMFCFASHIVIISFSSCSALFPSIFVPRYASAFRITKVFRLPLSLEQVSSVGEGATQFMQWDMAVGFAAMLSLGSITCMKALMVVGWYARMRFITFVLTGSLVIGPGTTLSLVNWIRDEHLLATNGKPSEKMG